MVRLSDVRPLFQASLAAAVGGLVGATSMPFDLDMVGRLLSGVAGLPWTWFALIIPALVLLYRVWSQKYYQRMHAQLTDITLVVVPYRRAENQGALRDAAASPYCGPSVPAGR